MAFFKFRKGADESNSAPAQAQNIEGIRQRAKYRLVGASVLVLAGVIGLPLLFDKQPRPIAVDTLIDIPDKNKVVPLIIPAVIPVAPVSVAPSTTDKASAAVANKAGASSPAAAVAPVVITESATVLAVEKTAELKPLQSQVQPVQETAKSVVKEAAKAAIPAASAASSKPAEANRAQSLLDAKEEVPKTAKTTIAPAPATVAQPANVAEARYVVQVGAFSENARAHEVRLKLEQAGLKTYAQVAQTNEGNRIRVRVGPFASKAEAEKAAEKIKKLSLPARLLTL